MVQRIYRKEREEVSQRTQSPYYQCLENVKSAKGLLRSQVKHTDQTVQNQ
jgi:hypothetical protein